MVISDFKKLTDEMLDSLGNKCKNLVMFDMPNTPKFICITDDSFENNILNEKDKQIVLSLLDKKKLYAVRSSANLEDLKDASFAGMYDTYLNVRYESLGFIINKCYTSKNEKRVKEYCGSLNIDLRNLKFSVIIQEMVDSNFSGVINTINPITNNPDEVLISVVSGLGEKLVSGLDDSTNYYVNISNLTYRVEGKDILTKKMIKKLVRFSLECQKKSKGFLDIEYAIKNNKIYFLQARNIATYSKIDITKNKTIYDNSNIIESYNNVVTPLTISFAKFIYKEVYTKTFQIANVKKRIIEENKDALDNMIEEVDSRLYYNLNSWYQLNSLFKVKNSKGSMEQMMGVKSSGSTKNKKFGLSDYFNVFINYLKRVKYLKKDSDEFSRVFEENYMKETRFDFSSYSFDEVLAHYKEIEENVLDYFTIPVINDTACMFSLNKLKKNLKKHGYDVNGVISDLITNSEEVLSSKGASSLNEILTYIINNCKSDFTCLSSSLLYQKYYIDKSDKKLYELIDKYITMFGCRVSNELKLETITYSKDEKRFIELLKKYIINDMNSTYNRVLSQTEIKNKKLLAQIEKTRYYIANRERLRLYRTHVFQIVRNMFDRCGKILFEENLIDSKRDIYFLTIPEINNINSVIDLKALIEKRKETYEMNRLKAYPERIVKYGNEALLIMNKEFKRQKRKNVFYGIGSNKGVIEGEVVIIDDINSFDLSRLTKDVIVFSYATDPGWVRIFPLIGGLIVERGSILSHASVVSREMGLKCVVSVTSISNYLKDGVKVKLDSDSGEVVIYEK